MDSLITLGYKSETRPFLVEELDTVMDRLASLKVSCSNPIIATGSLDSARRSLHSMALKKMVDIVYSSKDEFVGIVVYDIGNQWYSEDICLIEHLVLCVSPNVAGFGRVAIEIMQQRADFYDAKYLLSGNSTMNLTVPSMYTKAGFKSFPVFYKELIDNG